MIHWKSFWLKLQAERIGTKSDWDDLRKQSEFLDGCLQEMSSSTNVELLASAICELWRQIDIQSRTQEAQQTLTDFLDGLPQDAIINAYGVENFSLGLRRRQIALSLADFQTLLSENLVLDNHPPAYQAPCYGFLSQGLHDRSWLRNPRLEYHESMQGHGTSELPQYSDVVNKQLSGDFTEMKTGIIKYDPHLELSTRLEARHRRRTYLTNSDSTNSHDLLPPYQNITSSDKCGVLWSQFIIDPRSRYSLFAARQIGVSQSMPRIQYREEKRRSEPFLQNSRLTVNIKEAREAAKRRRSLNLLEADEVERLAVPLESLPNDILENNHVSKHSTTASDSGTSSSSTTRDSHRKPHENRSTIDSRHEGGRRNITISSFQMDSSPAWSWAESISMEVDFTSEDLQQTMPCSLQHHNLARAHAFDPCEKPRSLSFLSCTEHPLDVVEIHEDQRLQRSSECTSMLLIDTFYKNMRQLDDAISKPTSSCSSSSVRNDTLQDAWGQDQCPFKPESGASIDENASRIRNQPRALRLGCVKDRLLWPSWFINSRGNEYFCDVDEEYLTDRFNLTGLNTEVQYYQYALDLITDVFDVDCEDEMREQIEKSARHLYGLVHARYIVTTRGQQKMMDKFKVGDFGKCPRVACDGQSLLPMGQHDIAHMSTVKLYCARCEDLYNPKSSRHAAIDGAYFGTSFHNIFFQVYPHMQPPKSQRRYEPRIYGFKVHASAALARWQAEQREKMKERLKADGLETGFEEEEREDEMHDSEGEEEGQDGIDDMFEGQRVGAPVKR